MDYEKNDVDISKLFIWGKKYEITDSTGKENLGTVWMRLLGDADVNKARVYAIRKSRELRLKLLDPASDERLVYTRQANELSHDDLINYVTMFSMREITNKALKEVTVESPKMPRSNASLKKMEQYQHEIDEYPEKLNDAIKKFTKKEVDALQKTLRTESDENLYKIYIERLIDELCEQEALSSYNDMVLFLGCYKDEDYKIHLWNSFEDFANIPTETKIAFRAAYEGLNIKIDDLKKLREATQ